MFIATFACTTSFAQPSQTNCSDTIIGINSNCIFQELSLQNIAEPSPLCSDTTIVWHVLLDIYCDGTYDFEFLSDLSPDHIDGLDTNDNGIPDYKMTVLDNRVAEIRATLDIGPSNTNHKILWLAKDVCGNRSHCTNAFLIVDKTPPTISTPKYKYIDNNPYEDGFEAVPARALVDSSEDNCTSKEDLIYTFGGIPTDQNRDHYFWNRDGDLSSIIQYDSLPIPDLYFSNADVHFWSASKRSSFMTVNHCYNKMRVSVYDESENRSVSNEVNVLAFHDAYNCDLVQTTYLSKIVSEYNDQPIQYVNFGGDSLAYYTSFLQENSYVFGFLPYYFSDKRPIERTDIFNNGLSTRDILFLENEVFAANRIFEKSDSLLMDIDQNGSIGQLDISYLKNLILRRESTLQNHLDWRFYHSAIDTESEEDCMVFIEDNQFYVEPCTEFDNTLNVGYFDLDDFHAVKGGDLSGNASHNENHHPEEPFASDDLNIIVDNIELELSQAFECSFYVEDDRNFHGIQIMLLTDAFTITDIESDLFDLSLDANVNVVNDTTYITMHSLEALDVSAITRLFTITAIAKRAGNIKDLMIFGEDLKHMRSEGYVHENFTPVRLRVDELSPYLKQNFPNPFNAHTEIEFFIQNPDEAVFSIYAADGKLVYKKDNGFKRGLNLIDFDKELLQTSGVYFYQLHSKNFIQAKKMVFLN